jgi:hypothetical protein
VSGVGGRANVSRPCFVSRLVFELDPRSKPAAAVSAEDAATPFTPKAEAPRPWAPAPDTEDVIEALEPAVGGYAVAGPVVVAGAATLALGWIVSRRTLLASRPYLTRKWFGMFGPTVWKCARCNNQITLGTPRCETCGQHQNWPKWSVPS